jgi:hypothetical protein
LSGVYQGGIAPQTNQRVTCNNPLKGTIRIDIYKGTGSNQYNLIGRIYLFDLGLVDCTYVNSAGIFKEILENNGILEMKYGSGIIKIEPQFTLKNNILSCRIVQLRPSSSGSSGGFVANKLAISLVENYVREQLTPVYNMKIQVFGPHEEIWLNYLQYTYGFTIDPNIENTMVFPQTENKLILTQSLCRVDLQ